MILRNKIYSRLARIALSDFADIVENATVIEGKLRLIIKDGSFIDIWLSVKKEGIYAYHWERRSIDKTIYRYDNLPDRQAKTLETYPKHFHDGTQDNIVASDLNDDPEEAIRILLEFASKVIKNKNE